MNETTRTAAGPRGEPRPEGRSARLVQFTDTHLLVDPQGSMRGAKTLPRLQACLDHALRHFFPADAVLLTGDIVHDEPAAYGAIDLLFAGLGLPVLLLPGNHDVPDEMQRCLAHPPFQVGGQFRVGAGWQVVLLESWFAESAGGEGQLGAQQLAELDRMLAEPGPAHSLVCLHHPPVPMDSPALDALGLLDGAALNGAVAQHPRVRGVCWGHAHQALDVFTRSGVRFMCTPATAMQFRPRSPTFEADERPPGYRVIDLLPDGAIATEVAWLEGYRD